MNSELEQAVLNNPLVHPRCPLMVGLVTHPTEPEVSDLDGEITDGEIELIGSSDLILGALATYGHVRPAYGQIGMDGEMVMPQFAKYTLTVLEIFDFDQVVAQIEALASAISEPFRREIKNNTTFGMFVNTLDGEDDN